MDDLAEGDLDFLATRRAHHHAVAVEGLVQVEQLAFQRLVAGIQRGAFGGDVGLRDVGQLAVELQLAGLQAQALEAVVDRADGALLQLVELGVEVVDPGQALLQLGQRGLAFGDHRALLLDADQGAVEVAPLAALQGHQVGRLARLAEPFADHPGEVAAVDVAVADLEQFAGHELGAFGRHRQAGALQPFARHFLALHFLADHGHRRLAGHRVLRLQQVGRPEVAEAAHGDHGEQPDGHDHRDGHRAAAQPDAGGTALDPVFQGILFHSSEPFIIRSHPSPLSRRERGRG
ncbi:hypothetical protein FQZ97_437450 [compost metagenome]